MVRAIPLMLELAALYTALIGVAHGWIVYEAQGEASLTHYDLPRGAIVSCGCTGDSTHYPTAGALTIAARTSIAHRPCLHSS